MKTTKFDWNKYYVDYYQSLSFWQKVEYQWIHFWGFTVTMFFWRLKGNPKPNIDIEYSCTSGVHSGEQFEDGTVAK